MNRAKLLAGDLGWSDSVLEHACKAVGRDYGEECIIELGTGLALHCPPYPQPCTYVRVVQEGFELSYWDACEWGARAESIMGEILEAAASGERFHLRCPGSRSLHGIEGSSYDGALRAFLDS